MEAEAKPPFREVIWHFVCSQCKLWWSFATDDNWKPKEWYCPHCGHKKKYEQEQSRIYKRVGFTFCTFYSFRVIWVGYYFHKNTLLEETGMKKLIIALALTSTPALAVDRVAQYDFDQDGKVSFEDVNRYCTVSKALFARADKNNDGFLTNSEMRTAKDYLFSRCSNENKVA